MLQARKVAMATPGPATAVEVTRNLRALEWGKAELVSDHAALLRALVSGDEDAAMECLADGVIVSYLLARRLGKDFAHLSERIQRRIEELVAAEHEMERWYGDLTALGRHLAGPPKGSRLRG
jgi:hypothetical protein